MRFGFCMGAMDCVYLEFTLFVTGRALGVCLETRKGANLEGNKVMS